MSLREWKELLCGCLATDDSLVVIDGCFIHRELVPEGGELDENGDYGPIDIDLRAVLA